MFNSGKIFVLGVLLYLCPRFFISAHDSWGYERADNAEFITRAESMRYRLWRALALVGVVVGFTLFLLNFFGYSVGGEGYWVRVAAVVIALSATLGRGGWEIQTWNGQSVPERVDRGMYKLSQISAVVLLLFVLSL